MDSDGKRESSPPNQRSWRELNGFLWLYFGSIFFAVLVAPFVQRALWWVHGIRPSSLTDYLVGKPFGKIFDRVRWLPILIFLPMVMRRSGFFDGFCRRNRRDGRGFFRSFALAVTVAGGLILCQALVLGVEWRQANFVNSLMASLLGALVVGALEEIVFREFLLRASLAAMGRRAALIFSALFFAYVHFKFPPNVGRIYGPHVSWDRSFDVGFSMIFGVLRNVAIFKLLSLFSLGYLLNLIRLYYGNLVRCIGFHSGIVFAFLTYRRLFRLSGKMNDVILGGMDLTDSAIGLLILILIIYYYHAKLAGKCRA